MSQIRPDPIETEMLQQGDLAGGKKFHVVKKRIRVGEDLKRSIILIFGFFMGFIACLFYMRAGLIV